MERHCLKVSWGHRTSLELSGAAIHNVNHDMSMKENASIPKEDVQTCESKVPLISLMLHQQAPHGKV